MKSLPLRNRLDFNYIKLNLRRFDVLGRQAEHDAKTLRIKIFHDVMISCNYACSPPCFKKRIASCNSDSIAPLVPPINKKRKEKKVNAIRGCSTQRNPSFTILIQSLNRTLGKYMFDFIVVRLV